MPHFNEAQLEVSIIQLFLLEGYEYCPGETVKGRQPDEVLIKEDLRAYLKDRYKGDGITDMEVENAYAQYAVRDYSRPMGVATYKTIDDMPEPLHKALPDAEKMMEIINKK